MLRIKRSVQATFNVQVNFMSAQMVAASSEATGALPKVSDESAMGSLEAKAAQLAKKALAEAAGKANGGNRDITFVRSDAKAGVSETVEAVKNPDEINIDEDESSSDEEKPIADETK